MHYFKDCKLFPRKAHKIKTKGNQEKDTIMEKPILFICLLHVGGLENQGNSLMI